MGCICGQYGTDKESRTTHNKIDKPLGNYQLGRRVIRCKDTFKRDLGKIGSEDRKRLEILRIASNGEFRYYTAYVLIPYEL
jgi:hypothetical protein